MKLNLQNEILPGQNSNDVLVLILDQNALVEAHDQLPEHIQAQLNTHIRRAQFKAKLGDSLAIYQLDNADFNQVLLVGAGELDKLTSNQSQTLANTIYKALSTRATSAVVSLDALNDHNIEPFVLALHNAAYRFDT